MNKQEATNLHQLGKGQSSKVLIKRASQQNRAEIGGKESEVRMPNLIIYYSLAYSRLFEEFLLLCSKHKDTKASIEL